MKSRPSDIANCACWLKGRVCSARTTAFLMSASAASTRASFGCPDNISCCSTFFAF